MEAVELEVGKENLASKMAKRRIIQDAIDNLNKELKTLNSEKAEVDAAIISEMQDLGTDRVANVHGTASVKIEEFVSVSDWDSFGQYVMRSGDLSMLQKRVSQNVVKEYAEVTGEEIPGIEVMEVTKLNFRRS